MDAKIESAYEEELQLLNQITLQMDAQLKRLQAKPRYYGNDYTEQALENIRETGRHHLAIAADEPYFGRLDFQETTQDQPTPLYIGKVGVENEQSGQLMVIDWRAPVASLFYSFSGGDEPAQFESPEGIVAGLVYLKRNLVIRKQILQRVVDTYNKQADSLAVTDEFLLYRLGENKDNRLRDIVSTIQAEQDRIIRSAKNTALIIQGVAGSGKTTVALHRLAYLLYQYRDNIHAEKMIIFAPNSMFLDYISGVLPELGVGNIQQTTFTDWALDLLDQEVKLADPMPLLEYWFSVGPHSPVITDQTPGRFKGSLHFMRIVDACLARYEQACVPPAAFVPWEGISLEANLIHNWFYVENKHYPLIKRRERVVARIKRWLEIELNKVWEAQQRKELKKKANQRLSSYLKSWPDVSPFTFYKLLFSTVEQHSADLLGTLTAEIPNEVKESAQRLFKKKQVNWEDLAPLLYIRSKLLGIENGLLFDHVVIDEAQDFSPFQIQLLKLHTRGNSFTILGDLSQGIHAYQGILQWQEFKDVFTQDTSQYFQLDRSYRSTMEIINFANVILTHCGETVTPAIPVFRSGENVKILSTSAAERLPILMQTISQLLKKITGTIAVIGRTEAICKQIHTALLQSGHPASLIHAGQRKYEGGLSVVPAYLAKGLEFDAVLMVDVDAIHYKLNAQDAKLLYVGCTRALHELWILYTGEASPLIKSENVPLLVDHMINANA